MMQGSVFEVTLDTPVPWSSSRANRMTTAFNCSRSAFLNLLMGRAGAVHVTASESPSGRDQGFAEFSSTRKVGPLAE